MKMEVQAATDIGLRRTQNEDHFMSWSPADPAERQRRGVLLVVADGMGGARAGEVASHVAVDAAVRSWREAKGEQVVEELAGALEAANRAVHAESLTHPELSGMGTTLTLVVCQGGRVAYAHVGDSRAYLVRDGSIRQLTEDHSLVAQLVRDNQLTPEQARVDPRRNVVTRSVGVGTQVEIDAASVADPLRRGDTLVLSTDGLHGLVTDDEIAALAGGEMSQACDHLIELARERGGHDNITVVLARFV
jgi:serine/threonine protein phosphatase PrpC